MQPLAGKTETAPPFRWRNPEEGGGRGGGTVLRGGNVLGPGALFTVGTVLCVVQVSEVIRKIGVTEQTHLRWKKKYGGLGSSELRRLRQLEEENRKLKQMVADLSLDKHMLQEAIRRKP